MFFLTLLLFAAAFVGSQLLTPEPNLENAKAATLDEFNFPTATEGRVIPMVWGTTKIEGANVIWYGNLDTVPIRETVRVSMFNKKTYTTGYKYYVSIQFGLCLGEATLTKIWVDDELIWSGSLSSPSTITLDSEYAKGEFAFYPGSDTQSVDTHLSSYQTNAPAYRGLCYGVLKHGFVGESTSIKSWAFEVQRIPNGLSLATPTVNTYDCNLMNVMYEILTDDNWGYGYNSSEVDTTTLTSMANTLTSEGNGISYQLSSEKEVRDLIDMIQEQADCFFRIDNQNGQFTGVLVRDDYDPGDCREANEDNIIELSEFSRGAWDGTVNYVRIRYSRRDNDYAEGYAPAQDMANMSAQGRVVTATYTYEGVKNDALANQIAWRELREKSYPLAKAKLKVNRTFWDTYVGEVIILNYTCRDVVIDSVPMRVINAEVGNLEEPEIILDLVQDIFAYKSPSFANPAASSWSRPSTTLEPFPSAEQLAFEAPYAMSRRAEYVAENRIWCAGVSQGKGETGFVIKQRNGVSDPSSGDFYDAGNVTDFMEIGTLASDITPTTSTIEITTDVASADLVATESENISDYLTNLILIGDEFVAFETSSDVSGGVQIATVYRGLMDSAQKAHSSGESVYFICLGGDFTDTAFPVGNYVDLRFLPYRDRDGSMISISDVGLTEIEIATDYRERKPYPPTRLEINSVLYPTSAVDLDNQTGSTEDERGLSVEFNRRDFRIYDELSQLSVDAETINADFPSNNTTQYRLRVYDDPAGTMTLLFTIDYATITATGDIFASRTKILRYNNGVIPTTLRASVGTQHTDEYSTVRSADQDLYYDFDCESTDLENDNNWGVVSSSDTYTSNWTAPDTGSYAFTLGTAGPAVWASVNDGTAQEIISAGNTTGSLTGVTASDTIKIKYIGTVTGDETIVLVESPTSTEDSYAIFV